ncbi:MAG: hypothetical protein JST20_00890 [Bacteroidetes bacterium]|nr:hypothetical protein [Bacteroidota bacterium]
MRFVTVFLLICSIQITSAQTESSTLSGSMILSSDFYGTNADATSFFVPRRPSALYRMVFTPTITIDEISLPFSFILSSTQTNVITPTAPNQSFAQFVQNPMNTIQCSPKYKWIELHFGTYVPQFSELTAGNSPCFGAGFDLSPLPTIRFAGFAGTLQRAIEPDSAGGSIGIFARRLYALKLGFGKRDETFIDFNYARSTDEVGSLIRRPVGIIPQEGINVSINSSTNFGGGFSLKSEIASSVFTRNTDAVLVPDNDLQFLGSLITVRQATRLDFAGTLTFGVNQQTWGANTNFRYLGDGYVPLGYLFYQSDMMEATISPFAYLLENKLTLGATFGWRRDNLIGTKSATTNQIIGAFNGFWQVADNFSIAGNYANYGIRNSISNDTLRIQNISQNISISPSYTILATDTRHTISLTASLNSYTDSNPISGAFTSNDTRALILNYALALATIPFIGTFSISNLHNNLSIGELTVNAVSLGGSYTIGKRTLIPSLTITYSTTSQANFTPDTQYLIRLGLIATIDKALSLTLNSIVNFYQYGTSRLNTSFSEKYLQLTASYIF